MLSIPNYLPSRQGKSLDYASAGVFDKILQKCGKNKWIRLILSRFFNPSETFFKKRQLGDDIHGIIVTQKSEVISVQCFLSLGAGLPAGSHKTKMAAGHWLIM